MLAVKMSGVAQKVDLRNPLHPDDKDVKRSPTTGVISVATHKGLTSSTNKKLSYLTSPKQADAIIYCLLTIVIKITTKLYHYII